MKRMLFALFCLSISTVSFGQNAEAQKQINDVKFFGVDFSKAQAYGATDTEEQFKDVFGKINGLFISEAKKYDIAKYFKKNVTGTLINQIKELNENITGDTFFGESEAYQISEAELAQEVKSLPLKEAEGTGLIFVAELLHKSRSQATYHIVFFDIASRDILDTWKATGKARGFGLRNYWAGSIYDILEGIKIKKNK